MVVCGRRRRLRLAGWMAASAEDGRLECGTVVGTGGDKHCGVCDSADCACGAWAGGPGVLSGDRVAERISEPLLHVRFPRRGADVCRATAWSRVRGGESAAIHVGTV